MFDQNRYEVSSERSEVLFVNPHPQKGLDVALFLAKSCPDIRFRFVLSWSLSSEMINALKRELGHVSNVKLFNRTTDMRQHYSRARILLAPSRWAETWGRVVTEAQFSGIPALASDIGGLKESVGRGGISIDPEARLSEWKIALRAMWDDPVLYRGLVHAATEHVKAVIDTAAQVTTIERLAAAASRLSPS